MKLTIIGATGNVGSRILTEALARKHDVTVVARDPTKIRSRDGLKTVAGDTRQSQQLAEIIRGSETLLVALQWTTNAVETFSQRSNVLNCHARSSSSARAVLKCPTAASGSTI
ncbi:NAD(P)H-binding protein [Mesorhizobium sp. M1329]|uniref:NAD(P)H-binding protein n=1 Tax=Mesorhizobium sp. M1329 TaxID=2957083 RepID=UPI00333BE444